MLLNGAAFALPFVAFLLLVVFLVPRLTEHYHGYTFDYLGSTIPSDGAKYGSSLFVGRFATLTPSIIMDNVTTLLGMPLAPHQTSPTIQSQFGAYPGSQVNNLPKVVTLALFFGAAAWLAWRGPHGGYLWGTLAALVVYWLFLSLLLIRHIPVATGYYYGSGFACLFSLLCGLMVGSVCVVFVPAGAADRDGPPATVDLNAHVDDAARGQRGVGATTVTARLLVHRSFLLERQSLQTVVGVVQLVAVRVLPSKLVIPSKPLAQIFGFFIPERRAASIAPHPTRPRSLFDPGRCCHLPSLLAGLFTLAVVLIQLDNFSHVHAGWQATHRDLARVYPWYRLEVPLDPDLPFSADELRAIYGAWRGGRLEEYLAQHTVSLEAAYLVFDIRLADGPRHPGRGPGM